jgi:hypothetical protein
MTTPVPAGTILAILRDALHGGNPHHSHYSHSPGNASFKNRMNSFTRALA